MLVKSMRDASFGDSLFPGENKMFRDMYDQKIAEAMTRGKGLGLSGMISRQLSGQAADGPALDTRAGTVAAIGRRQPGRAPAAADGGRRTVRRAGRGGTDGAGTGPDCRPREQQHAPLTRHRRSLHRQPAGR
ncbi:hypothetical protein G6F61_014126 [Rhizopus arrhizus]|nr:hypothetical protein G6F61_014126 [Rhizopus arrhizus]